MGREIHSGGGRRHVHLKAACVVAGRTPHADDPECTTTSHGAAGGPHSRVARRGLVVRRPRRRSLRVSSCRRRGSVRRMARLAGRCEPSADHLQHAGRRGRGDRVENHRLRRLVSMGVRLDRGEPLGKTRARSGSVGATGHLTPSTWPMAGRPTVRTPKNGMNTRIGTSRRLDIRAGGNSWRGSDHALGGRASGDASTLRSRTQLPEGPAPRCWHGRAVPTVRLDARGGGNVGHGATTISRLFQWCRSEWG